MDGDKLQIRRAVEGDARGVHDSHMESIRSICSADHSPEEIAAWGGREFDAVARLHAIQNHYVWVVDLNSQIVGHACLKVVDKDGLKLARIHGLYLTSPALGRGVGRELVQLMVATATSSGATKITLGSTITAHEFYQRAGFADSGPMMTVEINGIPVRCFPMVMDIGTT